MLLLRVVDFPMWLHPLWEIGLTSKGKIIAICIVQKFPRNSCLCQRKGSSEGAPMTSIASWLESDTNVLDMGGNHFLVPESSVQHFYITMLLSHLIHGWYWTCRYEQKAFGSHMVTTQQLMFSTYSWHKCTEKNVWHHYNMHLESRTYETLCKSKI